MKRVWDVFRLSILVYINIYLARLEIETVVGYDINKTCYITQ